MFFLTKLFRCFVVPLLLSLVAISSVQGAEQLPAELAFQFSARGIDEKTVEVRFNIAPKYYLYQNRFQFSATPNATVGTPVFPQGSTHNDPWFGPQTIFRDALVFTLPVSTTPPQQPFTLTVTAQGCADAGVCYPPTSFKVELTLAAMSVPFSSATNASSKLFDTAPPTTEQITGEMDTPQNVAVKNNIASQPSEDEPSKAVSLESDWQVSNFLKHSSVGLILLGFYLFGLGLSFTPCVLPMVPILSGIIVGCGTNISRMRAFLLSLAYVFGMALTYAIAGVVAALIGEGLAAWFQNVWVLGAFALIFIVLALSMFGLFELQLPPSLQNRLTGAANKRGGSLLGLSMMGALSALIVGPCVAAPLAGALVYISTTGNILLGGSALFMMGIGMGTLLIAVGVGVHLLPKTGAWMKNVNRVFGVLLLATAIWIISPVIPAVVPMFAWGTLFVMCGVFLRAIDPLAPHAHNSQRFFKGMGVLLLLCGATLVLGGLAGSKDPLRPLAGLYGNNNSVAPTHTPFERIKSVEDLQARLASANKPVMLDFYADWCISCKEMERDTFSDNAVHERLKDFILLQADVTANDKQDRALLKHFGLFGPPGIIFFNKKGQEINTLRVIGFMSASRFSEVLETVRKKEESNNE